MLSILITTYNYDTYPLVKRLHNECIDLNIPFEIICSDDASTERFNNREIEKLSNCLYCVQSKNIGLSKSRNFLIDTAKYDWVILLDCDTYPANDDFINRYITNISEDKYFFFSGGQRYSEKLDNDNEMLRWVYGKKRESNSVAVRQKNPYDYSICLNICFNKKELHNFKFDDSITKYGYEDLVFFKKLQQHSIKIKHIDNEVYHLKLDTSQQFLEKTNIALQSLKEIISDNKLNMEDSKLTKAYSLIKKLKIEPLFRNTFIFLKRLITRNLLSKKPSIFLFDIYKLGNFCIINNQK